MTRTKHRSVQSIAVSESNKRRAIHGMTKTPEHKAWRQMQTRCYAPNNPAFENYGARGIKVCDRWRNGDGNRGGFQCFFADMGLRPSPKHSLDRWPNNDGDYEPSNCRWATREQQNRNTRRARIWIVDGLRFESSGDAARHLGVNQSTIVRRAQSQEGVKCEPK